MRSGFSDGTASSIAATPVRCAPSAPARATISGWPSISSAAPACWIAGASALMVEIMLRGSLSRSRTSTAATSAAASSSVSSAASRAGSSTAGVAR
ncbi:hypothetical protein ACVIHH_007400 [Bradyrhizobium sp. USDA 4518]